MAKRRKRRKRRNPKKLTLKGFGDSIKELWSKDTAKNSLAIAVGSTLTPLAAGAVTGMVNRNRTIIPEGAVAGHVINLLSAVLIGAASTYVNKKAAYYVTAGGIAGVVNDIIVENIYPMIPGLSDYATLPPGMGDYATLPPGMGDYATLPPGMGEYATAPAFSGRTSGEF